MLCLSKSCKLSCIVYYAAESKRLSLTSSCSYRLAVFLNTHPHILINTMCHIKFGKFLVKYPNLSHTSEVYHLDVNASIYEEGGLCFASHTGW